jgi:hypothetical protein
MNPPVTHTHAQDQLDLVGPNTCNSDQTNHGVPGNAAHAPQGKWKTCTAVLAAAEQSRQGPPRASAPCCTCTAPIHWFRCAPMLLLAASAAWVLAACCLELQALCSPVGGRTDRLPTRQRRRGAGTTGGAGASIPSRVVVRPVRDSTELKV